MKQHGHTKTGWRSPTYSSWHNMVARCTQPSNPAFAHYQKRGITVCDRWRKFINFLADMGERPVGNYTIDRWPDNNGNYEPGNCRWATKREQANNRITNKVFMYQGELMTMENLARKVGVHQERLKSRLLRGKGGDWTVEGAINTPSRVGHRTDAIGSMETRKP